MFRSGHVLVVGGTGFIGSHLVERLRAQGNFCTTLGVQRANKVVQNLGVPHIVCDLTDFDSLQEHVSEQCFDYVVNLGGYINHNSLSDGAKDIFDAHLMGVINLVQALNKKSLRCFIQIGSSDEYGNTAKIKEESAREYPATPYGVAKSMATQYLLMLNQSESLPVVILRPFLVFGPGQKEDRFIPGLISSALNNKIFEMSYGNQVRDFCYVDDIVDGIMMTFSSKVAVGQIINLASGKGMTVKNMVEEFQAFLPNLKIKFGARKERISDSADSVANVNKAKNLLNWTSTTPLRKGLMKTVEYYVRQHHN